MVTNMKLVKFYNRTTPLQIYYLQSFHSPLIGWLVDWPYRRGEGGRAMRLKKTWVKVIE